MKTDCTFSLFIYYALIIWYNTFHCYYDVGWEGSHSYVLLWHRISRVYSVNYVLAVFWTSVNMCFHGNNCMATCGEDYITKLNEFIICEKRDSCIAEMLNQGFSTTSHSTNAAVLRLVIQTTLSQVLCTCKEIILINNSYSWQWNGHKPIAPNTCSPAAATPALRLAAKDWFRSFIVTINGGDRKTATGGATHSIV